MLASIPSSIVCCSYRSRRICALGFGLLCICCPICHNVSNVFLLLRIYPFYPLCILYTGSYTLDRCIHDGSSPYPNMTRLPNSTGGAYASRLPQTRTVACSNRPFCTDGLVHRQMRNMPPPSRPLHKELLAGLPNVHTAFRSPEMSNQPNAFVTCGFRPE